MNEKDPELTDSQVSEEDEARRNFLKKVTAGTAGATIAPAVAMLMSAATAQAADAEPYSPYGGGGGGCGCGCGGGSVLIN